MIALIHRRPHAAVGEGRNDESAINADIERVRSLAVEVVWAVDIIVAPLPLLLTMLARAGQIVPYASGPGRGRDERGLHRGGHDRRQDSFVIVETVRIRHNLTLEDPAGELARSLDLLVANRTDLIADRVRLVNRLSDLMTGVFPVWKGLSMTSRAR